MAFTVLGYVHHQQVFPLEAVCIFIQVAFSPCGAENMQTVGRGACLQCGHYVVDFYADLSDCRQGRGVFVPRV